MDNVIVCAHCNTENSMKNLFCQNCGKPLTTAKPAEPIQPDQAAVPVPPPPVIPASSFTPPPFTPVIAPPTAAKPAMPEAVVPEQKQPPTPQAQPFSQPGGQVSPPPAASAKKPVQISLPALKHTGNQISQFGNVVESWMELVEDGAAKGPAIADEFDRLMVSREIPGLSISRKEFQDEGRPAGRTFHVLETESGCKVAVFFGSQGKDLRIGWTLYSKPTLNLIYLVGLLGVTAVIALIITLIAGTGGFGFVPFMFGWVNRFYNWLLPMLVVAAVIGFVWKGDWLFFFCKRDSKFTKEDGKGIALAAHQSILKSLESAGVDTGKLREIPTDNFLKF